MIVKNFPRKRNQQIRTEPVWTSKILNMTCLSDKVSDKRYVSVLFVPAVFDVGDDWKNATSTQQVDHAVQDRLLQFQLKYLQSFICMWPTKKCPNESVKQKTWRRHGHVLRMNRGRGQLMDTTRKKEKRQTIGHKEICWHLMRNEWVSERVNVCNLAKLLRN